MVDLNRMPLPMIEWETKGRDPLWKFFKTPQGAFNINGWEYYADGTPVDTKANYRITAIHPAEPAADGWYRDGDLSIKRFGQTVVIHRKNRRLIWSDDEKKPEWLDENIPMTIAEIDAAYAAHVAAKPVLVWDDSMMHLKTAKHGDGLYTLRYQDGMASWDMEFHSPSTHVGFGRCDYLDGAKEHCERHAKGE